MNQCLAGSQGRTPNGSQTEAPEGPQTEAPEGPQTGTPLGRHDAARAGSDRVNKLVDSVRANLGQIRARIVAAGGDPDAVTVVAVTKGFGPEAARAAWAAGLTDVGENYAQELLAKADHVPPGIRWHFIGPVQRNKVGALAPHVQLWQSVDRPALADAIARRQPGARVLVQVKVSEEATKHGCEPNDAPELVEHGRKLGLDVAGLMTIGKSGTSEEARSGFRMLADLGRQLGTTELSMGMTGDLEMAIQEGATMARIGRGLFGSRPRNRSSATVGSLNGGD